VCALKKHALDLLSLGLIALQLGVLDCDRHAVSYLPAMRRGNAQGRDGELSDESCADEKCPERDEPVADRVESIGSGGRL
jgi:hypothetical protein